MSHISWIFEGNKYTVGENLKTTKPNNVAISKTNEPLVYYKKKVYSLSVLKWAHINRLRAAIQDIYDWHLYWTNAEHVFWIIKE